jgi:hypothetical protein
LTRFGILFKADRGAFQRMHSFLSQIFDYGNPPPQLMEFKHSSGKDGPNLKNRLKTMI